MEMASWYLEYFVIAYLGDHHQQGWHKHPCTHLLVYIQPSLEYLHLDMKLLDHSLRILHYTTLPVRLYPPAL